MNAEQNRITKRLYTVEESTNASKSIFAIWMRSLNIINSNWPLETHCAGAIIMDSMRRLAEWRHKRGQSQRDLAKVSGVGYVTIARIETGVFDPRLSTLRRLAKALKVKLAELMDE